MNGKPVSDESPKEENLRDGKPVSDESPKEGNLRGSDLDSNEKFNKGKGDVLWAFLVSDIIGATDVRERNERTGGSEGVVRKVAGSRNEELAQTWMLNK
ncbi:hypothetical protein NDU88_005406 [Pleurodeles waltl]|uniref:Uncharacterized protein n=1 Tax=Pleurodeles waltl TaxID=8319 RepID=A0AAV7TX61_PLEWA|nr:hypothetical protein NDU88_005406 [Pleurodeles waltl]